MNLTASASLLAFMLLLGVVAVYLAAQELKEQASAIIFAGDFETGDLSRWDELRYKEHIGVTRDPAGVHSGKFAMEIRFEERKNGGEVIKWFLPGYDEVYVR